MATDAYRLRPRAEADLADIWRYTARIWSPGQAERYHADIVAVFQKLGRGAMVGRPVDIRKGYFKCLVGSHVVFYRMADWGIEVVRVLHRRMDVDRHL